MLVFHRYKDIPASCLHGVTAIGNFDGVHKGHQKILLKAKKLAEKTGKPLNVLTFEPHPKQLFKSDGKYFRITPIRSKTRLFAELGIDNLIIMHFTPTFAEMTAEKFVKTVLFEGLQVSYVVVGEGYRFGHDRKGNVDLLKKLGKKYRFKVASLKNMVFRNKQERISSSAVRFYIERGQIRLANKALGHNFEIEGAVIKGRQLGRLLGYPTANIALNTYVMPRCGVYAAFVAVPKAKGDSHQFDWYEGVVNFGVRPTVNGEGLSFEVHILNFKQDLYGQRIRVQLVDFLRPELKMDNLDMLKKAIKADISWSKIILEQFKNPKNPAIKLNNTLRKLKNAKKDAK